MQWPPPRPWAEFGPDDGRRPSSTPTMVITSIPAFGAASSWSLRSDATTTPGSIAHPASGLTSTPVGGCAGSVVMDGLLRRTVPDRRRPRSKIRFATTSKGANPNIDKLALKKSDQLVAQRLICDVRSILAARDARDRAESRGSRADANGRHLVHDTTRIHHRRTHADTLTRCCVTFRRLTEVNKSRDHTAICAAIVRTWPSTLDSSLRYPKLDQL